MEDYTEFVSFDILGDEVKVLCTETVYGTNVVIEIDEQLYYLGLVHEHIKSGRMSSDIGSSPNLFFASIGWQEYKGRHLSEADTIKIVRDNQHASIKSNSK